MSVRRSRKRDWISRGGGVFVALSLACVAIFAVLPVSRLLMTAFAPGGAWNPSAALAEIVSRTALQAALNTLEAATLSSLLALVIGGAFAVALAITDVRGKGVLAFLFTMSLLIAPQVVALAFKTMAGPSSPLLGALGLAPPPGTPNPMLGREGIVLVLGLHHAPLVAVTLAAGLRAVPSSVIEAARIDGAGPMRTLLTIVGPLLRPHIAAAALIAFVAGAGNFGIPALLGIPAGYLTLPTLIYRKLSSFGPSVLPDAAALAVLVGAITMAAVALSAIVLRRPVRLDGEAPMTPFWRLGAARLAVEVAMWLLIALAVASPLLSLLMTALIPAYGVALTLDTVTLTNFVEVLARQDVTRRALANSIMFAGTAACLTAMLAIVVAYALDRDMGKWRAAVEAVLELPYALPGVVIAIACILLFLRPLPLLGVSLYATPYIIIFAYVARFLPLALKPPLAQISLLGRDPEEAAAVDGARSWQRLRYIVIPQLLPAAVAGGLMVFLVALNELTVSALLWSAGTETLGVALLSLEEAGLAPEAAAIAVTATAAVALIMLALDRFKNRVPDGVLPWVMMAGRASRDRAMSLRAGR